MAFVKIPSHHSSSGGIEFNSSSLESVGSLLEGQLMDSFYITLKSGKEILIFNSSNGKLDTEKAEILRQQMLDILKHNIKPGNIFIS
jgi:hypothetical protein